MPQALPSSGASFPSYPDGMASQPREEPRSTLTVSTTSPWLTGRGQESRCAAVILAY